MSSARTTAASSWPSSSPPPPFRKRPVFRSCPGLVAFHRHKVVAITRFDKAIDALDAVTRSDHEHVLLAPNLLAA
jgi:hypothetical protein